MELGQVAIVVRDYDEAIAWYRDRLGFVLLEDTPLSATKRWVVMAPEGNRGVRILLAKAANAEQDARVGDQIGGRVFLFLYTDDFRKDYETLRSRNVRFIRDPSRESYGQVVVFVDLYGNKWDLVERPIGTPGRPVSVREGKVDPDFPLVKSSRDEQLPPRKDEVP